MDKRIKWTEEESNFLIKNYYNHGPKYCSEILNKTRQSICHRAMKLKLKYKNVHRNNGIVLCKRCHTEFHYIYGIGDNTKEQYLDFKNNYYYDDKLKNYYLKDSDKESKNE